MSDPAAGVDVRASSSVSPFIVERLVAQAAADNRALSATELRTLRRWGASYSWSNRDADEDESADDAGLEMRIADLVRRAYRQDLDIDAGARERYRQDYRRLLHDNAYLALIVSDALGWTMNAFTISGTGRFLKLAGLAILLAPVAVLAVGFGLAIVFMAAWFEEVPPTGRMFGVLAGAGLCAAGGYLLRLWRREIRS